MHAVARWVARQAVLGRMGSTTARGLEISRLSVSTRDILIQNKKSYGQDIRPL